MFLIIIIKLNGYFITGPVITFTAELIDSCKFAFLPGIADPHPNLLLIQPMSYLLMAGGRKAARETVI